MFFPKGLPALCAGTLSKNEQKFGIFFVFPVANRIKNLFLSYCDR